MASVEIKEIDRQGRIIIPKKWREELLKGDRVVLKMRDESIEILPLKSLNLTNFFDSVEVDLKSDLADWHAVRKELRWRPSEVRRQ